MGGDAGEGAALEPLAGLQKARRDHADGARSRAGCESRLRLRRQVEQIGRETPRVEMLGESGCAPQERLDRRERRVAVGRLAMQQAHAVNRIADGTGELPLERSRIVGGIGTGLERDDFTSKPCATASSIPRSVASWPAASASKQRKSRFVSRASSRSWASVSAVPIEATTGAKPACRNASTSVFPSTTTARSSRAIACRAVSSP